MIGVTLPIAYPAGILYDTEDGILYPKVNTPAGHYVFDRFQPTQALTSILLEVFHCDDVGYLIRTKTNGKLVMPTGVLTFVKSRVESDHKSINKDRISLVFKGDFYLHHVENTATLLTIDSLPEGVEKLLTISG